MKSKVLLTFCLSIAPASEFSFAKVQELANTQIPAQMTPDLVSDTHAITTVLAIPSSTPRGPEDILRDYETAMGQVTQQFSSRVAALAQAVQTGQLTTAQGEAISGEQYHMAQMQFDLLNAWHDMLEQEIVRARAPQQDSKTQRDDEIVMVALPFSSLQLDPSVAEYLGLSSRQIKAIRDLMSEERRKLEPLMAQLQSTKAKLLEATDQSHANEQEVKTLAAAQAGMLSELIVENFRMVARLYKVLTPEQQRQFDDLKRSTQPSFRAGG